MGSSSSSSSKSDDEIEDISSDDDNKAAEEKVADEQARDDKAMDEQDEKVQDEESIPEPQFINDNPDISLTDVLKETAKIEVHSMVEVPVTQENPVVQRPPLVDTSVKAMSRFNIPEAIDKSVKAHLLKNVLPKGAPDFGKIKQEKAVKQSMSMFSTTPFDEAFLEEYDQKDKLLKLMRKSNLKNNLLRRRDVDMTIIKILQQIHKRRKRRESKRILKTVHDVEMEAGESVEEDVVDAEDPSQEPTVDDAPKQTWFNEMVNSEKDPLTFNDVMGSVVDFTKFTKNCLKKDKITKVDLEGPAFKLLKGKHRNYIELEYNMEQCYLALTYQLDWVNPKGDRIPHDISKPLPLHGAPGRLTIPVDFFFNKDLEYLTTWNVEKKYATSLTKPKDARKGLKTSNLGWKAIRQSLTSQCHSWGYNDGMPKRAWTDKDHKLTASMLKKIEETLLTRRIMRSLECFVGGRKIEMDYRLLTQTK
ncbi:hypothetical protein Tco_0953389 [Tanacetum coccineum]|uniref:Uncharacterized protein n=1 Tax=Tanacetum coccineum TaxID=301880 RepID=A0ABQ5E0P2_9ASTR